ncbi:MAG: NACHT domain-containing protein [Nitrospira sp.]|nr:NACHT domain-containing protein [Nitrospira sp.]
MIDPVSISSFLSGIISHILAGVILKKNIIPNIEKKELERELKNIIKIAIDKTSESKFANCFSRREGKIDDSFWKDKDVIDELWGTLTDIRNIESIPDFNKLYGVYFRIYERGWIEQNSFNQVIDKFWTNFLVEARKSEMLSPVFERKIIFLLDETVYPAEGLEMIREYCQNAEGKLERRLFNKFNPIKGESPFPEGKIKEEFFDYHRTQMAYVKIGERGYKTEKIIDGDEYLKEEKLIIVGDGGIGKTRFMSEVEKKLVADIASSGGDPEYLPFYIRARDIDTDDIVKLCKTKIEESLDQKKYTEKKIEGFIRYLKIYRKLFPLIDAFDQVNQITSVQKDTIYKLLSSSALFGECRCFITTRPNRRKELMDGLKDCGVEEDTFRVVEMRPFTIEELPRYFKDYHPKVERVTDKLRSGRDEEINLIQIPMFAELVKVMAMKDELDPEVITANNRSWLLKKFVYFIIEEQVKKDISKTIEEKETEYSKMLKRIEDFSLKALEDRKIYEFEREYAQHVLGDDYDRYWPLMIRTQFIYFFDYESIESLEEKMHRYRHQIFQEYFAAKRLHTHRRHNVESMRLSMQKMEYMPEVGRFLSEIVETETKKVAEEFHFWQALLVAENSEDWVRTYALQVRDKLGEMKAKDVLDQIFAGENKRLRVKETTDNMIAIPAGRFLMGSYEYGDEWPVRLIEVTQYEISKYPVTNEEFIEFLMDYKRLEDDDRNMIIEFKWSRIKASEDGLFEIDERYKRHPVTCVTWYGATEYCRWRSKKEGVIYRLPTEKELEKAARGTCGRRYPWGDEFDKNKCNTNESAIGETTPVDKYPNGISPYGCFDMAGNVWEWTDSWYDKEERYRVLRGGSWFSGQDGARCASRFRDDPGSWYDGIGFRCVGTKK